MHIIIRDIIWKQYKPYVVGNNFRRPRKMGTAKWEKKLPAHQHARLSQPAPPSCGVVCKRCLHGVCRGPTTAFHSALIRSIHAFHS